MKTNTYSNFEVMKALQLTNNGGVSFEKNRNKFRGFVTLLGTRYSTKYYTTRLGARRALSKLIRNVRQRVVPI